MGNLLPALQVLVAALTFWMGLYLLGRGGRGLLLLLTGLTLIFFALGTGLGLLAGYGYGGGAVTEATLTALGTLFSGLAVLLIPVLLYARDHANGSLDPASKQ